jgi:hypothetical protein
MSQLLLWGLIRDPLILPDVNEVVAMDKINQIINKITKTLFHGVRAGGHETLKQAFAWGFGRLA